MSESVISSSHLDGEMLVNNLSHHSPPRSVRHSQEMPIVCDYGKSVANQKLERSAEELPDSLTSFATWRGGRSDVDAERRSSSSLTSAAPVKTTIVWLPSLSENIGPYSFAQRVI